MLAPHPLPQCRTPWDSPNPRGCPPIRTIFQSSPDALVNNKLLGNLKRERKNLSVNGQHSPCHRRGLSLGTPRTPPEPLIHSLCTLLIWGSGDRKARLRLFSTPRPSSGEGLRDKWH